MDNNTIPQPPEEFNIIDMSDGVVIKVNGMLHTINSTAYEIFQLCDGQRTIREITDEMCARYSDEKIVPVIEDFIDQLYTSELLRSQP